MKQRFLILSLILFLFLSSGNYSQKLYPVPVKGGTQFFFRGNSGLKISKVAIAGTFNDWNKNLYVMVFDKKNKYWTVTVPLTPDVEYMYKLVLNDTLWITDPNAPSITEDEWRNGLITPQKYGIPFVKDIFPPKNKRLKKIPEVTAKLEGFDSPIDKNSLKVYFNDSPKDFNFDNKSSELRITLDSTLKDGEHKISLTFADKKGNVNEGAIYRFFLDRYITSVTTPSFYDTAIMYEIFIRKFHDPYLQGSGDFNGLKQRLDYLKRELSVNAIWLMPFNESTTEHGYNVTDYYSIEKDYGLFEHYYSFLTEAKKRDIKVIMDFVINHTDSCHEFFLDAYKNPSSKYTGWYQFRNKENSDWNHFGIDRKMPKLNFDNPEVQEYFIKAAKFWIDPDNNGDFSDGIDGFRCDAAKEVPHSFWNRFRKEIKNINKDILLLGEVWDNSNFLIPFFKEEFDMLFDYPLYYALERYAESNDINSIIKIMHEQRDIFPVGFQMTRFVSNHDNDRPLTKFGSIEKLKQILAILFTFPGTPMIYYGDELAFEGKLPPENVRQNFDWNKMIEDKNDTASLLNFYKTLTRIREDNPVLSLRDDNKTESLYFVKEKNYPLLAYLRHNPEKGKGKEVILTVINNSGNDVFSPEFEISGIDLMVSEYEILLKSKVELNGINNYIDVSIKNNILKLSGFSLNKGSFLIIRITS